MALTEAQIARKRELGIPVHLEDSDHEYRSDGFCNCGQRKPGAVDPWARSWARVAPSTRGKGSLDISKGNGAQ